MKKIRATKQVEVTDIAKVIAPNAKHKIIGIRPGEKLHEEMISSSDSYNTFDLGKYYTILPSQPIFDIAEFCSFFKAKKVEEGFSYNSLENSEWETLDSLSMLLKNYES